jgi:hypothetical protein
MAGNRHLRYRTKASINPLYMSQAVPLKLQPGETQTVVNGSSLKRAPQAIKDKKSSQEEYDQPASS